MRRWHEDRDLMLGRWRQEIANHERGFAFPVAGVPPEPDPAACHCYRGMGVVRESRATGCGHTLCGLCHPHKRWPAHRRRAQTVAAVTYEWDASGGW